MEMIPIPIELLHMMNAEDETHEVHEDPNAIIDELEKNKRQPLFGGSESKFVDPMTDDHGLVPIAESPHPLEIPGLAAQTDSQVHNDAAAYSPLYIFLCIVIISALGFFFWHSTAKDKF